MQPVSRHLSAQDDGHVDLEALVQAEQLDIAASLAPLTIVVALVAVQVIAWLFLSSATQTYFVSLDAIFLPICVGGLVASVRRRNAGRNERRAPDDLRAATLMALAAGLSLATLPIALFSEADAQERSLILAACAGLIGAGMSFAVLPRLSFAFAGPIVVGAFIALVTSGEAFHLVTALLLALYAAFLSFLTMQLSGLIRSRALVRIALERERGFSTLLLKEFEDNANDWLWETDGEMRLVHLSDRIADVSGIPREAWSGEKLTALLDRIAAPESWATLEQARADFDARRSFRDIVLEVRIHGQQRWWRMTGTPTYVGANTFAGYRGVGADITDKKRAENALSFLALHDGLTDLPNRVYFEKRLEQASAALEQGVGFAVCCLDLDDFKDVNDSFGHAIGDRLLRLVAERLSKHADKDIFIARLAADEFTILLTGDIAASRERLATFAKLIIAEIGQPMNFEGVNAHVGVGIGIAMAPEHGDHEILRRADLALLESKAQGKNSLNFYQAHMDKQVDERRALASDLRVAMANDEFLLHFQPLVNAATEEIQGFEALLRWRHKTRGFVSPVEFIPLAEETGVIVPLGEWTLRQACRTAASWPLPLKIAVNLSPIQFRYSDLPALVACALEESGLPPHRLELELTESAFLEATQLTQTTLQKLRALGVRMSLDDFGTGYSSLSYLRRIPFDKIKIDRCFVQDLPDDTRDLSIVRAVVDIATAMGMAITAEGVETSEQSRCLLQQGCHQLQGYLFSRPVPAEGALALMQTQRRIADAAA